MELTTPITRVVNNMATSSEEDITFESLVCRYYVNGCHYSLPLPPQGVNSVICEACAAMKWTKPTKIQQEVLPVALTGDL